MPHKKAMVTMCTGFFIRTCFHSSRVSVLLLLESKERRKNTRNVLEIACQLNQITLAGDFFLCLLFRMTMPLCLINLKLEELARRSASVNFHNLKSIVGLRRLGKKRSVGFFAFERRKSNDCD